jgi:orotidine-5'-phosphate decarboxylase
MNSDAPGSTAREHLALALDVASLDDAVELAARLRPWFSVAKIGLELFSAEGPLAVDTLADEGFRIFVDLKLHDIPTTVGRAARRIGALGASYLTVHAAGGEQMLAAAVEGFEEGWAGAVSAGYLEPAAGTAGILAVTVLTSDPDPSAAIVCDRALLAARTGCLGMICAASDLSVVGLAAPTLLTVVPGIRLAQSSHDDQARIGGPGEATRAGADLLVIGRTVTSAESPELAAQQLSAEVLAALELD